MEQTITVEELISQLEKIKDKSQKVYICGLGFNNNDTWEAPLSFLEETVVEEKGNVYLYMSSIG